MPGYAGPRRFRQGVIFVVLLVGLAALAGCDSAQPTDQPTEEPPTEEPTREPVLADCFQYFHLMAWEDSNGDGVLDDSEPRLAGVEFVVNGPYAHSLVQGRAVTGAEGVVTIDTWAPGECSGEFAINAVPPADYQPTTELPVTVREHLPSYEYEFGFAPATTNPP